MKQKCDKCDRHATVHLTEIHAGEKIEKHLCEICAAKEGVTVQSQVPLSQLLEDFVVQTQQAKQLSELICPNCGMSFLEFRQSGLMGCAQDYETFQAPLTPLLERAQEGASHHVGKVPARAGGDELLQQTLLKLRADLKAAIQHEDYEQAARLRDQIKELEQP